jgi:tetratricopeptide (TPR) repeat protein
MSAADTYTIEEAHRHFAKTLNGEVWGLLRQPERAGLEDERMVYAAHASCYHWLKAGTGVNHQRGEWLIARVYTVLGRPEAALTHALRCVELTHQYADLMEDFDWAFAYEGAARANALAGMRDEALKYVQLAEQAGQAIADEEDRQIFFDDFNGGDWHRLR